MGVGRAVGAVTCAVDYIEKALDLITKANPSNELIKLFGGSGGINHHEEDRGKIEAIVLFTSKEVIERKLTAFPYEGCPTPGSVRDEINENLRKVWKRSNQHEGRKLFWIEVDIDNFQDCFDKVIKIACRFSPNGKQGKEIWYNLTVGSNSIGYALLSMSRLTGKSNKQYLLSQSKEYQKAVIVPRGIDIRPNKDNYFNLLPFWKTQLDMLDLYEILQELVGLTNEITTKELLNRLKSKNKISLNLDLETFRINYMLSLYSQGYTNYERPNQ
ncbi:MAG: hypothetical protein PUP92_22845 [Rhizonema sp. PD38]|nr:hypothetical protein [Rhizonema sp. PD38]